MMNAVATINHTTNDLHTQDQLDKSMESSLNHIYRHRPELIIPCIRLLIDAQYETTTEQKQLYHLDSSTEGHTAWSFLKAQNAYPYTFGNIAEAIALDDVETLDALKPDPHGTVCLYNIPYLRYACLWGSRNCFHYLLKMNTSRKGAFKQAIRSGRYDLAYDLKKYPK